MDAISADDAQRARLPFALRRVPRCSFANLVPATHPPRVGDLALARVADVGRTTRIELDSGRMSTLYAGDLLPVVFGHRYATEQYEAYAALDADRCALLTAGGVCGQVASKHQATPDPTRLTVLGYLADRQGRVLSLRDFALAAPSSLSPRPPTVAVCGASMDAGKTHAASSIIRGLASAGLRVGAAKLTGTASGRDDWQMLDAGAFQVHDFSDCGFPSTYGCTVAELLAIHAVVAANLAAAGADCVVFEIADGVLQQETVALLSTPAFTESVDAFVYAAADPLSVVGGLAALRRLGVAPVALSGKVTMSPLAMQEVAGTTDLPCLTAKQLASGELNRTIAPLAPPWQRRDATEPAEHQAGLQHGLSVEVPGRALTALSR